ncbi:alpha/beta hydrolase [Nocardia camponoti]|uniref:alpha/beta hydrolase n=1 Tax=Nocardia camponoti TaxID=1616106 RepID=UPI00166D0479|nr:alpha/beta hydrolase [Nocardia camponoti]
MTNDTSVHAPRTDAQWQIDHLGPDYQQRTLPLGPDPDGESGDVVATLVKYAPADPAPQTAPTVLYLHGFTDYFFQEHIAEHFAARGHRFYALDLRKSGRSRRDGQSGHFVSDLALYDAELNEALRIAREETGQDVLVVAHSTGGLVAALWLDRLEAAGGSAAAGIAGLVLNSPWLDLQGPSYYRTVGTAVINVLGRVRPFAELPTGISTSYGDSLHHTRSGEWDYNLDWKLLGGEKVRLGWLRAVRRGQARLHQGLNIGVPALVLRSRATKFAREYSPAVDSADAILDVKQIQKWAGCLGDRITIVPIDGARHDTFLSQKPVRDNVFRELDAWLDWLAEVRG